MHTKPYDAIPFIIGISGHRDPLDPDDVRQRCRETFLFIQEQSPHTPKTLLSGMAEGADQIAAQVALELGWQVTAVLPMPYDEYLNDFDEAAQAQLTMLLGSCKQLIELPLVIPEQVDPDISEARQQQYRNLGIFMIRHAQLMVLCWDGDDSLQPSPGGTLEVGRYCKKGVSHEGASALQPLRTLETINVPTPRASKPKPLSKAVTQKSLLPHELNTPCYTTLKLIDKFNCTVRRKTTVLEQRIKQSKDWLLGTGAHTPKLHDQLGPLLEVYAQADTISVIQQRLRDKVVLTIIALLFLSLLAQGAYGGIAMALGFLAIHIALLSIGWGLYHWFFKLKQLDTHYLDYRALAEGLRVQVFWQLHGIKESVSEHYLHSCNREIFWISESIRNLKLHTNSSNNSEEKSRRLVRQQWIEGQCNYFLGASASNQGKAYQHELKAKNSKKTAKGFLAAGIILTLITFGLHNFALDGPFIERVLEPANETLGFWINCLLLVIIFCFGLSAGIALYAEIQGHDERAASYHLAGSLFNTALGRYDAARNDPPSQEAIVLELGKEALSENANWLVTHRKVTQSFINPY